MGTSAGAKRPTKVFAETYKLYDQDLNAFSDRWKDVVVLGPTPESCQLDALEAFGRTCRLSPAGYTTEVPAEGFPEFVSRPDEEGLRRVTCPVPWRDAALAVIAAPIAPETLNHWFDGCELLREVRGLDLLDTSCARSMSATFLGCSSLLLLDVSGFRTPCVEDFSNLFWGCSALAELELSGFDTSRARNLTGMFKGCSTLTSLDVSAFDTSRVTRMANMFQGCSSLAALDLSGFDTANVEQMSGMFWGCASLAALDLSGFDLSSVANLFLMFRDCASLSSLKMPGIDPARAAGVRSRNMFQGATRLGVAPERLRELVMSGAGIDV